MMQQPHARLATPGLAGGEAASVAARGPVVPHPQPRFVLGHLFEDSDDICPLSLVVETRLTHAHEV
jgi:hypothetical protein